jgi:hypothetical protein
MNRITPFILSGIFLSVAACKPAVERQAERPVSQAVTERTGAVTEIYGSLTPVSGGDPVTLDQVSAQPALLVFFAPWSDSAAATVEWMNGSALPGMELVPVVLDRAGSSPVPEVGGRVVYRADEALVTALGVRAMPSALRIEAGQVTARWAGLPSFTGIVASATSPARGD